VSGPYSAPTAATRLQRRGPRPKATPRQSRPPQAVAPMGRTLRRGEGAQARHVQAGQRGWRGTHQHLEHPVATSLLPLARISKFVVVNYMPNTPVGSLDVKISKLIKLKGNLAFPRKPSHPQGLLRGGIPPQKKWSHFFAKICKRAKYDSTLASSEFRRGVGGQEGNTREPEIAYASARIQPFSLASEPAGYSWNRTSPTRIHLGKGKTEQCDKKNK
jgi:hypothetical protein